jgi:hypothetical protein
MANPETINKLLDLPGQIEVQERMLLGLKDDKAKVERKKKVAEAKVRLSESVKSEKNAEERAAAYVLECENDPAWLKHTDRLEELRRTIAKHEAQRDLLRRERESLRVVLEIDFVTRLEKALSDRDLVRLAGRGMDA